MRFLAALAFLFQLQPVVGSALCFHDAEMGRTECAMPHEERRDSGTLTDLGAELPGECPSMGYCAPAAPAVPKFAEHFQVTAFLHGAPALAYSFLAPGEPLRPPFHPPKV